MFTIALGDVIVPHDGFAQHLMRRGQQATLRPGSTTLVQDVIETAPLAIVFAPLDFLRTRGKGWVFLPQSRTLPRKFLGEAAKVTFD